MVFDVVEETTNLVQRTHNAVVDRSVRRFAPVEPVTSTAKAITGVETAISGGVFESIRVINGITRFTVNAVADVAEAGLEQPSGTDERDFATPLRSSAAGTASWYVDYLQASLNGFWGDHLSRKNSRLDLGMTLRHHGRHLPATP